MAAAADHERAPSPADRELIFDLCHEIGNELAGVRLSAHLLGSGPDPEERASSAAEIQDLAGIGGSLVALIPALLSKPRAHRVRLDCKRVLEALEGSLDDARATSSVEIEPGGLGAAEARIEPQTLHHLLVVLLHGALRATAGGGRVRAFSVVASEAIAFVIEDDAVAPDAQEEGAPRRGRPLAFALAERILGGRGGSLFVRVDGSGTRVELRLPRAVD